jgi:hypothetical protein
MSSASKQPDHVRVALNWRGVGDPNLGPRLPLCSGIAPIVTVLEPGLIRQHVL